MISIIHNDYFASKEKYIIVKKNFANFNVYVAPYLEGFKNALSEEGIDYKDKMLVDLDETDAVFLKPHLYARKAEISQFKVDLFLNLKMIPKEFKGE